MKKDYKVTVTVTSTHEYTIPECNTPEEAESIAEDWFADGEEGIILDMDVEDIEAVPTEDGENN